VGVAKLNISRQYYTVYVQSGLSELDQLVKTFIFFCQIAWLITVILRLYIDHTESA